MARASSVQLWRPLSSTQSIPALAFDRSESRASEKEQRTRCRRVRKDLLVNSAPCGHVAQAERTLTKNQTALPAAVRVSIHLPASSRELLRRPRGRQSQLTMDCPIGLHVATSWARGRRDKELPIAARGRRRLLTSSLPILCLSRFSTMGSYALASQLFGTGRPGSVCLFQGRMTMGSSCLSFPLGSVISQRRDCYYTCGHGHHCLLFVDISPGVAGSFAIA